MSQPTWSWELVGLPSLVALLGEVRTDLKGSLGRDGFTVLREGTGLLQTSALPWVPRQHRAESRNSSIAIPGPLPSSMSLGRSCPHSHWQGGRLQKQPGQLGSWLVDGRLPLPGSCTPASPTQKPFTICEASSWQGPGPWGASGRGQGSLGHLVATWQPPKCRVWRFHLPVRPKDVFTLLFDLRRTRSNSWQSCLTHKNNISLVLLKMQSEKKRTQEKN